MSASPTAVCTNITAMVIAMNACTAGVSLALSCSEVADVDDIHQARTEE
jgi:hypothetical protein